MLISAEMGFDTTLSGPGAGAVALWMDHEPRAMFRNTQVQHC